MTDNGFEILKETLRNARETLDATFSDPTPLADEEQDPEQWRLYRLCPCSDCHGTGKTLAPMNVPGRPTLQAVARCKTCRGEGRNLELVATCGSKEAVGVALITLADEGEFSECPVGIMHRPSGEKGVWKIKPWGPSPRQISDAGRMLARSRHSS